jgi:hypothetical protein
MKMEETGSFETSVTFCQTAQASPNRWQRLTGLHGELHPEDGVARLSRNISNFLPVCVSKSALQQTEAASYIEWIAIFYRNVR